MRSVWPQQQFRRYPTRPKAQAPQGKDSYPDGPCRSVWPHRAARTTNPRYVVLLPDQSTPEQGQPYHKIPSGEITNLPFLRHIGEYGKPVIMSTGMATLDEIEKALGVIESSGTPHPHHGAPL